MGSRYFFSKTPDQAIADPPRSGSDGAEPAAAGPADRRERIAARLKAHLAAVHRANGKEADFADIDIHADLYESGYLDSLSVSQFLLLVESEFGLALPDWLIGGQANDLEALAAYIDGKLPAGA